jgi:Ca2+/Na+ antiporter
MDTNSRLTMINGRITKLFKNPQINFLIIMLLVLLITCYSLISISVKRSVTYIISNPIVTVVSFIIILVIGYYDISIASLMLILYFIVLFGWSSSLDQLQNQLQEGFKNDLDQDEDNTEDDSITSMNKHVKKITNSLEKSKVNMKTKEAKDKQLDENVKNIKDIFLGTINKFRQNNDNDYKQALLENKHSMFKDELDNNSNKENTTKYNKSRISTRSGRSGRKRENFQTIEIRALDPSNEDDTNLLITKEILQDMLNRIEYNYESNKYLRKYIKHRIEEIIDLNKLADDE